MQVLAFGLLGAFCLCQILPLVLAFKGHAAWWLVGQVGFGLSKLALASIAYDGRGSWVLLVATGFSLMAATALSVLLALAGFHLPLRKARQVQ